jgi:hypothetical protein
MKTLIGAFALAALLAGPLAGNAQDRDGWRAPAEPAPGYVADTAYSYPDEDGRYAPFAYAYAPAVDTFYAVDPGPGGYEIRESAPPDVGWSAGAPPADCGRWIWRADRGAYEWIRRPCR